MSHIIIVCLGRQKNDVWRDGLTLVWLVVIAMACGKGGYP